MLQPFYVSVRNNTENICLIIFLIIVAGGIPMPKYGKDTELEMDNEGGNRKDNKKIIGRFLFLLSFLYFSLSTGMEGFFQSQIFVFGMCGPHSLPPKIVKLFLFYQNGLTV